MIDQFEANSKNKNYCEIGDYIILRTIGVGTSSKVKLAENKNNHQLYAIKIINKKKFDDNPDLKLKIDREIALMKILDHPHLLNLYDVLESKRHIYIVIEYASHGELFDFLIERRSLNPNVAMHFWRQIIYGVDFLHTHSICHRDLKPENILLNENDEIKIGDFGFAKWMKTKIVHTACGSPHYAAPEVLQGTSYDGRQADVWSCGVILYALLTGRLPFDDPSIRILASKIRSGIFRMPTLSPDLSDLLIKTLTVSPKARITIEGIKNHPAFRIGLPNGYIIPSPFPMPENHEPIDISTINPSILKFLHGIGYLSNEEIKSELESTEPNMAKSFVILLTRKISIKTLPWPSKKEQYSDNWIYNFSSVEEDVFENIQLYSNDLYKSKDSLADSLFISSCAERSHLLPESLTNLMSYPKQILIDDIPFRFEVVMMIVQQFFTNNGYEWLYPNDFLFICRNDEIGMFIEVINNLTTYVSLCISNVEGDPEIFQNIISQLRSTIDTYDYEEDYDHI